MNTFINHALLTLSLHKGLALLVSAFITSAAVFCVAAAAAMGLRHRSARSRSAVWRLGVVALLIVGAWRLMPDLTPPVAVMEWQVDMTPALQLETTVVELPLFELPEKSAWEKIAEGFDRWAVFFWLGMAALGFCLRVVGVLLGLRALRRRCSAASRLTQEIGSEAGLPDGTAYRWVSDLTSPMLTGWRKPVIWLPTESALWDESRLNAVLRHEAAHWQRGDWLWQWLAQAVLCLWWWQPLAWLARKQLRIETEHAADDLAVSGAENAPEYARTLVEIAAGLPSRMKSSLGVTMFGNDGVKQRVQALIKSNRWRGRIGMGALSVLTIVVVLLAVLAATKVEFVPQQPVYRSSAKLVAGGKMETNEAFKWQEHLQDFYGTIIETLESSEMQRRAAERVRALNPDLADHKVEVRASQTKSSATIHVTATSDDAKYARIYLDALLDEFTAFRHSVQEQTQGKVLKTFMQETVKKQKEMEDKIQALENFQRENNLLVITNGNNKAAVLLGSLESQRELAHTEIMDLELTQMNISASNLAQSKVVNRNPPDRNLSEMEQIYLKTQGELFVLKDERDYLLKSHKADHPEVIAIDEKMARANHLLDSASQEIQQDMQARVVSLKRKVEILDKKIEEERAVALDLGSKIANHHKLKDQAEAARQAYQKLFERSETFVAMAVNQSDYVAIQERASPATAQTTSSMLPIWKLWTPEKKAEKQMDVKKAKTAQASVK